MSSASESAIAEILRLGAAAPSGDNCQPWAFRRSAEGFELLRDAERGRHFMCVQGNADYIAHGAALENMDIAARSMGFTLQVSLFPKGESDAVVASLRLAPGEKADDPLLPFIETRRTNRKPYRREPLALEDREALLALPRRYPGAELHLVEGADKDRLARVATLSERLLFDSRAFHRDLYRWIRWTKAEAEATRDGLYFPTLELGAFDRRMFSWMRSWNVVSVLRLLGAGTLASKALIPLYESCSAIGYIQASPRSPSSFVLGGRLLQRVWLTAASRGLSLQPITGIPILIDKLHHAEAGDFSESQVRRIQDAEREAKAILPLDKRKAMVFLFRVGRGEPPSAATLRRVPPLLGEEAPC